MAAKTTLDTGLSCAILDSLAFPVTSVDLLGTILFVNTAAARNLSGEPQTLIGKSLYAFFPDCAAATRERIRQTASQKQVQHFESVVTLPDGTEKYFDSTYHPATDEAGNVVAVQIVAMDVTSIRSSPGSRKASEALWSVASDDLSMTPERLAAVLKSLPINVAIHDLDTTIRYMNWGPKGIDLADVIGTPAVQWLSEHGQQAMKAAFERVSATREMTEFETEGRTGRRWLGRLVPLLHQGKTQQVLSCSLDVTELRQLEAQLRHRQKIESLGTMAGGIAHDFNNLLTAIAGNLGIAQRRWADGKDPGAFLTNIETAFHKAAELCRQMMAYAGREAISRGPEDLNALVAEIANLARAAVSAKVNIELEFEDPLPPIVCSQGQVGQVLLNLINNAADAIGEAHGTITLTTDSWFLAETLGSAFPAPAPAGHYVRLRVRDTGVGIDAAKLPLIFDPFYSTKSSGHGLGLSAVLGIVTAHDAAIHAESVVGEGTTITLYFPVHEVSPAERAVEIDNTRTRRVGAGTILVVDDDDAVRSAIAVVVADAGYRVVQAGDGNEALARLKEMGPEIRAVVLDITMPNRDGFSTLDELRRTHPVLPVLLSSGKAITLPAQRKHDPHLFRLRKPYQTDELVQAIAAAIEG